MTHKKNDVDFRTLMRRGHAKQMWHFISNAYYRRARVQQIHIDHLVSYSIRHALKPISIYTNLKTEEIEDLYIKLSNEIERRN